MGTVLQQKGIRPGDAAELLNLTDPDLIRSVHRGYLDAGSRVIYANTFGANRLKLARSGHSVAEVVAAGVCLARECAAGTHALVALDVGPLGALLSPLGTLPFEEAYDLFAEVMTAGADADLIVIETMTDLYEVRVALLAAKERTALPVFVTMSFESGGRTFTGCTVEAMARTVEGLGADAVGINCSLGPDELLPLIRRLKQSTRLPVIAKPNAGLPDPVTGRYSIGPEAFAASVSTLVSAGADIIGGCCGTTPDYIRLLRDCPAPAPRSAPPRVSAVCTPTVVCPVDRIRVIGERINPTGKKRMQQALLDNDMDAIVAMAVQQMDAGAEILDVNVGYPGVDEARMLPRVVRAIQAAVDLPLQLDSADPAALEAALRVYNGKPAVNSVNGKADSLDTVLPLVRRYGAAVVGLTLDEAGLPETAEQRFRIAERILDRALALGIPREDVWIDCLTLTVSAQQAQAAETLKAVAMVRERLGLRTVLGVSNISFGLPNRLLVTQTFLAQALRAGLSLPIVNPNQREIMDTVAAARVLNGEDAQSAAYIARFADALPHAPASAAPAGPMPTLRDAIRRGMKGEAARLARDTLLDTDGMALVETQLIPALDQVGADYDRGAVFLPQLLAAAQAAQAVFDVVKDAWLAQGTQPESRGEIVMATVQGDIHDIGKNIVKTVLENYGYRVIDLGRDVAPATIADTARERGVRLVGLSALMTTTLPAMADTVRLLKALPDPPAVMVGGAVVTAEYARGIGADLYARDARAAVLCANQTFHYD